MLNKYNFSKELILKNGISEVSNFFVDAVELNRIEVIFECLKTYLLYESENMVLIKKYPHPLKMRRYQKIF